MNINVLEESKNKLIFQLEGEGHTLSNALRKELWNDNHVKAAAYSIDHPDVEIPRFIVETDGADPRKTLQAAAKRLQKSIDKVKAEAKNLK